MLTCSDDQVSCDQDRSFSCEIDCVIIDKNVDAIARLADHNYILDKGRVAWHGDSKSLLATADLKSRYLGV